MSRAIIACCLAAVALLAQTPLTWLTSPQLPIAFRGTAYSMQLTAAGGTPPRTFTVALGSLPPGLQLTTAGEIRGTPTQSGSFQFTLRVTGACSTTGCTPQTADRQFFLTVNAPALVITTTTLAPATGCIPYAQTIVATGGTPPYTWSATGLPSGLTINAASGAISGSAAAGSYPVNITVRDSGNLGATRGYTFTVNGGSGPQISTAALPGGNVGTPYSAALSASGGTPPYSFAAIDQPVPGLSLATSGVIAGTPTQTGAFATLYRVTDAGGACAATRRISTTIAAAQPGGGTPPAITTAALPTARADTPYNHTLTATGGAAPYVWSLAGGELPAGFELLPDGGITGTTSVTGVFSFLVRVTDSSGQRTALKQLSLVVYPALLIETVMLPAGRVGSPYNFALVASGGLGAQGGLTWFVSTGALPAGLQLSLFGGAISGTPAAAGEFPFEVTVRDAGNVAATKAFSLTIADPLVISTDQLPSGKIGQPYSASVAATGGVAPLEFEATGLPPGLTMDTSGAVSGTPTTSGAWVMTVKVTDATRGTAIKSIVITVDVVFRILTESLARGQAGTPYSEVMSAADGRQPYRWSVPPRTLPLGISLNELTGQLQGTPVEPGEYPVNFRVTDAANATAEKTLTISIGNGFRITTASLPPANVNIPYSTTLQTAGARTPITWSVAGGALPPGFALDAGTGAIAGRTNSTGEYALTIKAVDATFTEAIRELTLTVRDVLRLSPAALPTAEVGLVYQQRISALDAQGNLTWTLFGGIVPDGLRLEFSADGANITGTPAKAGIFQFSLQARDTAGQSVTQPFTLRVIAPLTITSESLRGAFVGVAYSVTLAADGGEPAYRWSLASGILPSGLQLDLEHGILSGNPSQPGTFGFTLEVRDITARRATRTFSIRVIRDLTPTLESLGSATVGLRYSQQLRAVVSEVSWVLSEGRLPDGLALDGTTGEIRGVPSREGTYNFVAEARDVSGASGSRAYSIVVARLELPRLAIDPSTVLPARQIPLLITLSAPAPADLTGTVALRFQSETGADDPAVRLSTGLTASFTVAQGSTRAVFPSGAAMLQTGTTAGTITLSAVLTSNGVAVTPDPAPLRTIRIPRAAPVLTTVTARRAAATLNVDLTGYATGREVTAAEFQFAGGPALTVSLQAILAEWYRAPQSQPFGSLFNVTIPFLNINASSVTVTLVNSVGKSEPKQAPVR